MRASRSIVVDARRVPPAIRASVLMRAGGCAIFENVPNPDVCTRLLAESRRCVRGATACAVATSEGAEVRGGEPARQFVSAAGGEEQTQFYFDGGTARFLSEVCSAPVVPTGGRGTYTYYARAGDHLALHRDIETCDVAVITCLLDRHHDGSRGGLTRFYPERQDEPLSRIRAAPEDGAMDLRLPVGRTMVMFGGLIPHLIEPIGPGELRIVSILCFRAC
jgi:hypothetical protein